MNWGSNPRRPVGLDYSMLLHEEYCGQNQATVSASTGRSDGSCHRALLLIRFDRNLFWEGRVDCHLYDWTPGVGRTVERCVASSIL